VADELADWASRDNSPQAESAGMWHSAHSMYMGPLRIAPLIRLWRTIIDGDDVVTIDWKHRPRSRHRVLRPNGGPHRCAADPPPGVELDLAQLRREHQDRAGWLERARAHQVDTDWVAVRAGARELLDVEDARA
jgi:hypothetical protein